MTNTFFFFKSNERRIVERWQNRKHQESTCLHRQQLHWKDLFDVTLLKLWGLLKACNLQRKAGIWNCGTFWPISTFIIVAATHSTSLSPSQAAAHMFQEQLRHSLWEPGWGEKKKSLSSRCQRIVLWALTGASDHRDPDKKWGHHFCCAFFIVASPYPFQLKWFPGDLNGCCNILYPSPLIFSFFPLWQPDIKD